MTNKRQNFDSRSRDARAYSHGRHAYRPIVSVEGYQSRSGSSYDLKGRRQKRGNTRRKKGEFWRILFALALLVFVLAAASLAVIGYTYWKGQNSYTILAEESFVAPDDLEAAELLDFSVDWEALKEINSDIVAWIYIPGTNINYPIVQTYDNETYLVEDFDGDEGAIVTYGCIFLDTNNTRDFSDLNNLIYGHHLSNGTMFAAIAAMEDPDEFNESRVIYLLTPDGNYKLITFSLVWCEADDPLAQTTFSSDEAFTAYVQDKIDRSVVSVTDAPDAEDITQTFAFVTCDNLVTDGRLVLYAYVDEYVSSDDSSTSSSVGDAVAGDADSDVVTAIDDAIKEITS